MWFASIFKIITLDKRKGNIRVSRSSYERYTTNNCLYK